MEIQTSKYLESTGYRYLFECVKEEGIVPVFYFVQDLHQLPNKDALVLQILRGKKNALSKLKNQNEKVIHYIIKHRQELIKLSFIDENVYNTLEALLRKDNLLNLYLDNAMKLEERKVEKIRFVKNLNGLTANGDRYYCEFSISEDKKRIEYISKYYTDGKVFPRLSEKKATNFDWCDPSSNKIPFSITNKRDCTFVLNTMNRTNFTQERTIDIVNFGFNGNKLPSEEELQSYKIPEELIRRRRKTTEITEM